MADAEQKDQGTSKLEQGLDSTFNFATAKTDQLEELAKLAETSERYEDMVVFMKHLVGKKLTELGAVEKDTAALAAKKHVLSTENRNLFSVAYKNVVGSRRSSWRVLSDGEDVNSDLGKAYKEKVAQEIKASCVEIQETLNALAEMTEKVDIACKEVAAKDSTYKPSDSHIFYLKMRGDYYRYLREAFKDNEDYKNSCKKHYEAAMKKAEDQLEPTDPTRLGLALNFSVCHYEILGDEDAACKLAKTAFDEAIEKLDSLNDASYKDSTLIMQLLRDNLTIWSSKNEDDQPQAQ